MSRRSTPQSKIDDRHYPVRIRVVIPSDEEGWSRKFDAMLAWLREQHHPGDYAHHGAGRAIGHSGIVDAAAFYFRDAQAAADFVRKFDLELADGTTSGSYSSPYVTEGKRRDCWSWR